MSSHDRRFRAAFCFARVALGCALLTSGGFVSSVIAAEDGPKPIDQPAAKADPKGPKPSLDDELLKDLNNELLEGTSEMKDKPKSRPAGAADSKDKDAADTGPTEVIDDTMPTEDVDPLVHVSQQMRKAEELIPNSTGRPHAEELQRRIVDDLARLIEQAEQQRAQQQSASKSKQERASSERQSVKQPKQQSAGSPGKDSNKPAQDSSNRLGKAEAARPDPELFKSMMKDTWGHLPARDREQVLQNTPDKFLPQYELMIERYYKRLAEDERSR